MFQIQRLSLFEAVPGGHRSVSRSHHRRPLIETCVDIGTNVNRAENDLFAEFRLRGDGRLDGDVIQAVFVRQRNGDG